MVSIMKRTMQAPPQLRDPRAATITTVTGSASRFNSRTDQWNAESAIANALYANVYIYACARARAQDLSTLPIRVGADPDKPKDFDPKHPLAKLLGPAPGGPTMNISARRLIAWSLIQYDVTGRVVWEIAPPVTKRRDGVPFELWPIPASYIKPVESTSGGEWFSSFDYTNKAHQKRSLQPDQVMYHWRPHASDWRKPESLLEAANLNVSIAVMQDRYDFAFLVNDARPAAVVVHEEFSQKRERDGFRRQFLEQHRGPDNAGKVAFVEASRDGALPKDSLLIQQLGLSQRDGEFINRMENQIRAICVAFNTPLSRLADSSRRTYSNAEVEAKHYWRTGVYPAGVEFCEAMNIQLMPMLGDSSNVCWFDTTGVPELDPPRRFAVGDIPDLLEARVLNRNEARTSIELAEIGPEGDEFEEREGVVEQPEPAEPAEPVERQVAPVSATSAREADARLTAAAIDVAGILTSTHESVLESCRAALVRRAQGKRGRQAAKAESAAALFDGTYWYNVCYERYEDIFRSVYLAVSMALPADATANPVSSAAASTWVRAACGVKAAEFVRSVAEAVDALSDVSQLTALTHDPVSQADAEYLVRSAALCAITGVVGAPQPVATRLVVEQTVLADSALETRVAALEGASSPAPAPRSVIRRILRDERGVPTAIVEEEAE